MKSSHLDLFVKDLTKPRGKLKTFIDVVILNRHLCDFYGNGGHTYIPQPGTECLI